MPLAALSGKESKGMSKSEKDSNSKGEKDKEKEKDKDMPMKSPKKSTKKSSSSSSTNRKSMIVQHREKRCMTYHLCRSNQPFSFFCSGSTFHIQHYLRIYRRKDRNYEITGLHAARKQNKFPFKSLIGLQGRSVFSSIAMYVANNNSSNSARQMCSLW